MFLLKTNKYTLSIRSNNNSLRKKKMVKTLRIAIFQPANWDDFITLNKPFDDSDTRTGLNLLLHLHKQEKE